MIVLEYPGRSPSLHFSPPPSPDCNDGFFWDRSIMTSPFSNFPSSSSSSSHPPREITRGFPDTSLAGTLHAVETQFQSGYSVSSILQSPNSTFPMADVQLGPSVVSADHADIWPLQHVTPPHSTASTPRFDPEFFPPVSAYSSAVASPTFPDVFTNNPPIPVRPSPWSSHPFHRGVPHLSEPRLHPERMSWSGGAGTASSATSPFPSSEYGIPTARLASPWVPESQRYPDASVLSGHSSAHKNSPTSESSDDAGSATCSPMISPACYPSQGSHSQFSFPVASGSLQRTRSSPNSFGRDNDPNPQSVCAVCGDHAACQHYGVRTCEGCKGFFKRTVQKGAKYVCLANKDCPVDKKRRNRCQFCRFQKCLNVVVRTDSLKGRRGRLPSKPKSLLSSNFSICGASANPHPSNAARSDLIANLLMAHQDSSPGVFLDYHVTSGSSPNFQEEIERFLETFTASLNDVMSVWIGKIPGFTSDISHDDRERLVRWSSIELISLRLAHRMISDGPVGQDSLRLCNGATYPKESVRRILGSWVGDLEELSRSLAGMSLDATGFSVLCALVLVEDRPFLCDITAVQSMQTKVVDALREYMVTAHVTHNWLPHMLARLQELHEIGRSFTQRLRQLLIQCPALRIPENLKHLLRLKENE